jgi:hypothetical protein
MAEVWLSDAIDGVDVCFPVVVRSGDQGRDISRN